MPFVRRVAAIAGLVAVGWCSGCAKGADSTASQSSAAYGSFGNASPSEGCSGLKCQVEACPSGRTTSISGTVYDPAGKNPLYNVVVYVPNGKPEPLSEGASCDSCAALYTGDPIAVALTDPSGRFTIDNVPSGWNIPLVIQIGKWRKQVAIPAVTSCVDNPQPDRTLKLPNNHVVGDMPQIAISTGSADTLECLLLRVGIDASEYVPGGLPGAGRIHVFQGGGEVLGQGVPTTSPPGASSSVALWDSLEDLTNFDLVLLSCEGAETESMNQQALFDYAAAGGRVFASHYHYSWFNTGPFGEANLGSWWLGTENIGNVSANISTDLDDGEPFPKGKAMAAWLGNTSSLIDGELPIQQARHNVDIGVANTASTPWIHADAHASVPGATEYFTFNAPLEAAPLDQCGRVVYSDLHVGAASGDYQNDPGETVPTGCIQGDLSSQEKALEFMLFDLSSCVTPDKVAPQPPETTK